MADTYERGARSSSHSLTDEQFAKLSRYIESELGIRMPPAKKIMLESRLQKRIRLLDMSGFQEYLDHVFEEDSKNGELLHMIDSVTTNKTDFFRESDHFDILLNRILPLEYDKLGWGRDRPLLIWSAASSTGEEPYTIAMTVEEFRREKTDLRYRILGTDISTEVLERARRGIYPEERIAPVPQAYRKRYLLRSKKSEERLVRVRPALRRNVSFHRLNLMWDDFGVRDLFEIVFCRNVIIYFDRPTQARLMRKLVNRMQPGGYLFLGHSETLAGLELGLESVAPTIYRKPD